MPIIFVVLWYPRWVFFISLFLGLLHIGAEYFAQGELNYIPFIRAGMFFFVGYSVAAIQAFRERLIRKLSRKDSELLVLNRIIDFIPDATLVLDNQGKVFYWNKAIEEMSGLPKEEVIGRDDRTYTIPFYGEARSYLLDLLNCPDPELEKKYSLVRKD